MNKKKKEYFKAKKSQAITDFVLVFALVVAALIGLQVYFSRSLQGSYKQHTDNIVGEAPLFSPFYSDYDRISEQIGGEDLQEGAYGFTVQIESGPSVERNGKRYSSLSVQETNHINRVISGVIEAEWFRAHCSESHQDCLEAFFLDSAPQDFKRKFEDDEVLAGYSVEEIGSVIDRFSDTKLIEDLLFSGLEND